MYAINIVTGIMIIFKKAKYTPVAQPLHSKAYIVTIGILVSSTSCIVLA